MAMIQQESATPVVPLWMNFIPAAEGWRIVWIGTHQSGAAIQTLCLQSRVSISFIGDLKCDPRPCAVQSYDSVSSLPHGSHDCAIVDVEQLFAFARSNQSRLDRIEAILDVLKPEGTIVFMLSPGILQIRHRIRLMRALHVRGLAALWCCFCEPNCENPLRIVPFSDDPSWAICSLSSFPSWKRLNVQSFIRQGVKRLALRSLRIHFPFLGLLAVGIKSSSPESRRQLSLYAKVLAAAKDAEWNSGKLVAVLSSQPYAGKEFFLVFDPATSELKAVAKACHRGSPGAPLVQQEYGNLILVSSYADSLEQQQIRLPRVLYAENSDARTIFVTTAAGGMRIADMVRRYTRRGNDQTIHDLVRESVQFLIRLHTKLNEHLSHKVPDLGRRYLENYLNFDLASPSGGALPPFASPSVQHGDLTAENVYLDHDTRRWEVIDWEWLGGGYPPLFDFFSLLRSIGAWRDSHLRGDSHTKTLRSFVRVFFGKGPFSNLEKEMLHTYCAGLKIDANLAFSYFRYFLLWRCNRYRLHGAAWHGASRVWEDLLRYAIVHAGEFALM